MKKKKKKTGKQSVFATFQKISSFNECLVKMQTLLLATFQASLPSRGGLGEVPQDSGALKEHQKVALRHISRSQKGNENY